METQMTNQNEAPRRPLKTRGTKWASAIANFLCRIGLKPNSISILSLVFACLSGACLLSVPSASTQTAIFLFIGAALGIQFRLLCNLFDGMVAIEGGFKTKSGEIFNDFPDRIADAVIFICAGYAITSIPYSLELGWLAALLAVMTAYVRLLGGSTGTKQYFIGPMAKQHRMFTMTMAFIFAAITRSSDYHEKVLFFALALICVGCVVTLVRRTLKIVRDLETA